MTPRLLLRPFRSDDLDAFVGYRRQPEVARFQSWDETYSMEDAETFLASQRATVFGRPGEWLQLAVIDRASSTLYGDCAVRIVEDQPATAEVGVTLAPDWQGRGLATEALGALLTALFEGEDLHRVFARADDRNVGSLRLLERLGFRSEARFVAADWFKGEWTTLRVYAILASEWADR